MSGYRGDMQVSIRYATGPSQAPVWGRIVVREEDIAQNRESLRSLLHAKAEDMADAILDVIEQEHGAQG